jgi:hypothetical protein
MTQILTGPGYPRLAAQFDKRAQSVTSHSEAAEYRARAAIFRELGPARLPRAARQRTFASSRRAQAQTTDAFISSKL